MATTVWPMVAGSTRPQLKVRFQDQDGAPRNMSGHTLAIALRHSNGSTTQRTAVAVDATGGLFVFDWQTGDFAVSGRTLSQLIVTYPDGGVAAEAGPTFDVAPDFRSAPP